MSSIEATKRDALGHPARDTKWPARFRDADHTGAPDKPAVWMLALLGVRSAELRGEIGVLAIDR